MSKERLEEIKQYLVLLHNASDVDEETKDYIFKDLKVEWLIEQAERVQELEDIIYKDERQAVLESMCEQNKRYREALEFYADEENYKPFDGIFLSSYQNKVDEDGGKKARQALEGEE